ncbi:MAG: NifB/NifX family molybdenum-iron cluster-binding protein [Pelotomaculum sp.]|jgi:predicted Fe-Mo cluster-binding NifX family protein
MITAVSSQGKTLRDPVAEKFESSPYLLLVETDDFSQEIIGIEVIENNVQSDPDGLQIAKTICERDCEVVITGTIEQPAFDVLAWGQVTRYKGVNYSAEEALALMHDYRLELIREYNGKEWEPHDHSHGTCSCGEH